MESPFKKPPNSSAYPITFSSSSFHLNGGRDRDLQKGVNLLFLCPEEGCPKRGEPPFPLRPEAPANSFDNREGR